MPPTPTMLEIFAYVGTLINDVFALITVIGSAILLIEALFRSGQSKRRRGSDTMLTWSFAGFIFGVLLQAAMYITNLMPDEIGIFLRFSPALVNGLLILSFLLILARLLLPTIRRHAS